MPPETDSKKFWKALKVMGRKTIKPARGANSFNCFQCLFPIFMRYSIQSVETKKYEIKAFRRVFVEGSDIPGFKPGKWKDGREFFFTKSDHSFGKINTQDEAFFANPIHYKIKLISRTDTINQNRVASMKIKILYSPFLNANYIFEYRNPYKPI